MGKRFLALPFLAALVLTSSSFAATMAWEVTGMDTFGTIDLSNGNFNHISNLGFLPAGLGQVGGALFTALEGGTRPVQIEHGDRNSDRGGQFEHQLLRLRIHKQRSIYD
jgi:hypothetical protein